MIGEFLKRISGSIEDFLIFIARRDRKDRLKRIIIFLIGIKKFILKGNKSLNWFRYVCGVKLKGGQDKNYYESIFNENYKYYLDSMEAAVRYTCVSKDGFICDFGCGYGDLVKRLKEKGYINVYGYEISPIARDNRRCDCIYEPFSLNLRFDVICLFSVLEHIEKSHLYDFIDNIIKISNDWIVLSIPVYPDNLRDFFDDQTHRTFERETFWDELFSRFGYYRAYSPSLKLPFVNLFYYRKIKKKFEDIWSRSRRNLIRTRMGIGDNLCILSALLKVKKKLPFLNISISNDSTYKEIFELKKEIFSEISSDLRDGDNVVEFHSLFDRNLHLLKQMYLLSGIVDENVELIKLQIDDLEVVDFDFKEDEKYICVDIRSGWASRNWGKEKFELLAKILRKDYGIRIIEVGRNGWWKSESEKGCRLKNKDFDFVDKLNIRQTAYLIKKSGYFLGNDSGLMHIASAVGAKSFIIFGPVEHRYREYKDSTISIYNDKDCYGCYSKGYFQEKELRWGCPLMHHRCMKSIKVEDVVKIITKEILNKNG